jgi:hypothetical protein
MREPFSTELTGTTIEREYRALASSIARVPPLEADALARDYDRRSVARARAHWAGRMVDEYSSTSVFASLATQLMEANAPLDTTAVALRMAQDELIHAEACAEVVRALGGDARAARPLRETTLPAVARHAGCTPRERALRNVVFATCVTEMNSVAYFVASLETLSDPYLRGVTRRLLSDEVLHGSFGFHYLEACRPWLEPDADLRASIAAYLKHGFAYAEAELTRGSDAEVERGDDDRALGLLDPGELRVLFCRTMDEAVVPGLERFGIPAGDAWKGRTL